MAQFDAKKFSPIDWTILVCSGVTFIALFLPWYSASAFGYSVSVDGWSTSYGWLGALILVLAGVYLGVVRAGGLAAVQVRPVVAVLAAAAVGTLIVIIRWATMPSGNFGLGISYGPSVGIFLALIAGIVQVVAAAMWLRREPITQTATPPPTVQ